MHAQIKYNQSDAIFRNFEKNPLGTRESPM
nr:MAG TPA: hypothetical protein [Microviridae sp.]